MAEDAQFEALEAIARDYLGTKATREVTQYILALLQAKSDKNELIGSCKEIFVNREEVVEDFVRDILAEYNKKDTSPTFTALSLEPKEPEVNVVAKPAISPGNKQVPEEQPPPPLPDIKLIMPGRRDDGLHCIIVSNLQTHLNEVSKLSRQFSRYGTIMQIATDLSTNRALVQFRKRESANNAISSRFPVFGNRFIKTSWAVRTPEGLKELMRMDYTEGSVAERKAKLSKSELHTVQRIKKVQTLQSMNIDMIEASLAKHKDVLRKLDVLSKRPGADEERIKEKRMAIKKLISELMTMMKESLGQARVGLEEHAEILREPTNDGEPPEKKRRIEIEEKPEQNVVIKVLNVNPNWKPQRIKDHFCSLLAFSEDIISIDPDDSFSSRDQEIDDKPLNTMPVFIKCRNKEIADMLIARSNKQTGRKLYFSIESEGVKS